MDKYYSIRSEQFYNISSASYNDYLKAKELYASAANDTCYDMTVDANKYAKMYYLLSIMDEAAVIAVVFHAFAVESYINLAGMYIIGEEEYYAKHEKKSIKSKIELIEEKSNKKFSEHFLKTLFALFDKRNKLAHQKPKSFSISIEDYNYENLSENYKDISKIFAEESFAYNNIESDMSVYPATKKEIMTMRNSQIELIEEISSRPFL